MRRLINNNSILDDRVFLVSSDRLLSSFSIESSDYVLGDIHIVGGCGFLSSLGLLSSSLLSRSSRIFSSSGGKTSFYILLTNCVYNSCSFRIIAM